jgi:hypothetical protein
MAGLGLRSLSQAPRLYRAARGAGASTRDAGGVLLVSVVALSTAARRSPGRFGRQNALRHFAWQACLTARYGIAVARAVAAEQERGTRRPDDTAVDEHNNEVGRRFGAEHAAELRMLSVRAAIGRLCDVAEPMWRSGELRVVERRP